MTTTKKNVTYGKYLSSMVFSWVAQTNCWWSPDTHRGKLPITNDLSRRLRSEQSGFKPWLVSLYCILWAIFCSLRILWYLTLKCLSIPRCIYGYRRFIRAKCAGEGVGWVISDGVISHLREGELYLQDTSTSTKKPLRSFDPWVWSRLTTPPFSLLTQNLPSCHLVHKSCRNVPLSSIK